MADVSSQDRLLRGDETNSASVYKSNSLTRTNLEEWPGLEAFLNYLKTTHELELTWSLKMEQFKIILDCIRKWRYNRNTSGNLLVFRVKDSAVPRMLHTFAFSEEAQTVDGYNRLFKQKGIYFLRLWVTRDVDTLFILPQQNTNNFCIIMLTTTIFLATATVSEYFDLTVNFNVRTVGEFLDFVTAHVSREHPLDFSGLDRESSDLSVVIKLIKTYSFHGSLQYIKRASMLALQPQPRPSPKR